MLMEDIKLSQGGGLISSIMNSNSLCSDKGAGRIAHAFKIQQS